MRTDELDYDLPDTAIAQTPVEPRDAAKLLVDRGPGDEPADATVARLRTQLEELAESNRKLLGRIEKLEQSR